MADRLLKPRKKNTSGWMKQFVFTPPLNTLERDLAEIEFERRDKGIVDQDSSYFNRRKL